MFYSRASLIGSPLRISTNYRYNLTKYNSWLQEERFIGIAPVGAPTLPGLRSACVGAGLSWRSLGRSLLANAMRVRLCYGLRLGGGSRKP